MKLIAYTSVLMIALYIFQWLTTLPILKLSAENGVADLSSYDLSEELVKITGSSWNHYPYELLAPEDFLYNNPTASADKKASDYGTFLLRLKLMPGQSYSITGKSFHFSQKVYIDGQLIDEVGSPGMTRNDTVPKSRTYVYSFVPSSDITEIIFQASSFHHRQGANGRDVVIAESKLISRYQSLENFRAGMVFGLLMTIFFYYIGMYLFLKNKKQFLFLALSALTTAVRLSLTGQKHLIDVFPDISWFLSIRLEYISNILFTIFFLLFFGRVSNHVDKIKFSQRYFPDCRGNIQAYKI